MKTKRERVLLVILLALVAVCMLQRLNRHRALTLDELIKEFNSRAWYKEAQTNGPFLPGRANP